MDQVPSETSSPPAQQGADGGRPADPGRPPNVAVEPTGIASVDQALAEVAAVADAPVSEHVEVFERAHERLRRALDAQPEPVDDAPRGA